MHQYTMTSHSPPAASTAGSACAVELSNAVPPPVDWSMHPAAMQETSMGTGMLMVQLRVVFQWCLQNQGGPP